MYLKKKKKNNFQNPPFWAMSHIVQLFTSYKLIS